MKPCFKLMFISLIFSFLSFINTSFAQITIDSTDFPATIGTQWVNFEVPWDMINFDVESTGANYFWDFTQANTLQGSFVAEEVVDPGQSPFPNVNVLLFKDWGFPPGSHTFKKTHISLSTASLWFIAYEIYMTAPIVDSTTIVADPGIEFFQFPLTYQSQWSDNYTMKIYRNGVLTDTTLVHYEALVDGWGQVVTPYNTFDCLRLFTEWSHWNDTTGTWENHDTTYTWLANSVPMVFQVDEYETDTSGQKWGQVRYYDPTGLTVEPQIGAGIPARFELHQNYPNPFNPVTQIRFDLPKSGEVQLIVYDILGRKVSTLVNKKMPAGRHEVAWNAANFGSGLYFYQMRAGNFNEVKKMLLVK